MMLFNSSDTYSVDPLDGHELKLAPIALTFVRRRLAGSSALGYLLNGNCDVNFGGTAGCEIAGGPTFEQATIDAIATAGLSAMKSLRYRIGSASTAKEHTVS
jgi:hypothetical protein